MKINNTKIPLNIKRGALPIPIRESLDYPHSWNTNSTEDYLPGGKADTQRDEKYNPREVEKGIRIELEHTDNKDIAKEIAKDHLEEIPDYYTRLIKMEDEAEKEIKKADAGGQGGIGATPEDWSWGHIPGNGDGISDSKLRRTNPKRYDTTRTWQGDAEEENKPGTLKAQVFKPTNTAKYDIIDPEILITTFEAIHRKINIHSYEDLKDYIRENTGRIISSGQWKKLIEEYVPSALAKKSTVNPQILRALREANMMGLSMKDAQDYVLRETGMKLFDREWEEEQRRRLTKFYKFPPINLKIAYDMQDRPDVQKTYNPYTNYMHNSLLEKGEGATESAPIVAPTGNPLGNGSPETNNLRQDPWGKKPDINVLRKLKPTPEQILQDFNEAPGHGGGRILQTTVEEKIKKLAIERLTQLRIIDNAMEIRNNI